MVLISSVLLPARSAGAESIWERSSGSSTQDERESLAAIERVLLGRGEERDLLRVRVALITLAKGEIHNPRAVVLLMRLRRELMLSPGRLSRRQLEEAVKQPLVQTMRAWTYLELSHLVYNEGGDQEALAYLDRAITSAWRLDVRTEVMMFRAWIYLRLGKIAEAQTLFLTLQRTASSGRARLQAEVGQALCAAIAGEQLEFERHSRLAAEIQNTRATVSGRSPFWELELSPSERQAVQIVMDLGAVDTPLRDSGTHEEICERHHAELEGAAPAPTGRVPVLLRLCALGTL